MNKPILRLFLCFSIAFLVSLANTHLHGQSVEQITNGESQHFDSNFEKFYDFNGKGYYSSYIDDRVFVFELDTKNVVYESSFDLCEKEIVRWVMEDNSVLYFQYDGIIIDNILDGNSEEFSFENIDIEHEIASVVPYIDKGILNINFFPGPTNVQFDLKNRRFLDFRIPNHVYTSSDYFYYTPGDPTNVNFIRFNRTTFDSDTLLSNFSHEFGAFYSSDDKYYLFANDDVIITVDRDDNVKSYDFERGSINSAVETSTGRMIFAEIIPGDTVLYELDLENSDLVRKDSIFAEKGIKLLDSYQDRLYVNYDSNFEDAFGSMDYPYLEVEVFEDELQYFVYNHFSKSQDLLVIETYFDDYSRSIILVEKASNEIVKRKFQTSFFFLDREFDVLDTDDGIRFIVSEEEGKTVYSYNSSTNDVTKITTIDNKRGLGTEVQKNEEGYLIANENSLHSGFEYIHPETKEVNFHQVDGIIHGDVAPFGGNFFYVKNQNYQGVDEDFYLDYIMFDPIKEEIKTIEEQFFYPKILSSFANINYTNVNFGFEKIYNSEILFDLKKQTSITPDPITKSLLVNIYFESENYYFSSTGSPDYVHYKIDKSNYLDREVIYTDKYHSIIPIDDNSFVVIYQEIVYIVSDDDIKSIDPPSFFFPNYVELYSKKLFLGGFDDISSIVKVYDLDTDEEIEKEIEGFIEDIAGDYIIAQTSSNSPIEITSTNLKTGDVFFRTLDQRYKSIFTTDTSIYLHNIALDEIMVLNPQLEEIESINAEILKNATLNIISEPGKFPILYRANKPQTTVQYRDIPDYSLIVLDPRTNSVVEYFDCENNLRFNKAFDFGLTSTMLLRSEEDGYQVYEVNLPEYGPVGTDDLSEKVDRILINPNPTDRFVSIDLVDYKATLYNSVGIIINRYQNEKVLDLENVQSGIYYLKLTSPDGRMTTVKIIKQ